MAAKRESYDTIESVNGVGKGSPPWWMMEGDAIQSYESSTAQANSQGGLAIDSISSAVEVESPPVEQTPPKETRLIDFTSMGKKIWEFLCAPLSFNNASTGTSNKAGGDNVTGLGSPTLEPPFQIDLKALQQLIKELKELNHQIHETHNETQDNEINEKERSKQLIPISIHILIEYYKTQTKLREEVAVEIKFQIVFHNNQYQQIKRELGDADQIRIDTEKDRVFWSNCNRNVSYLAMTVTAAIVVTVAIGAFSTGAGAIAIPAIFQMGMTITKCGLDLSAGATQFMKGILEKKVGELKEKTEVLAGRHTYISVTMKREMDQMNNGWEIGQKLTKEMIDVLKNYREAAQGINAK